MCATAAPHAYPAKPPCPVCALLSSPVFNEKVRVTTTRTSLSLRPNPIDDRPLGRKWNSDEAAAVLSSLPLIFGLHPPL